MAHAASTSQAHEGRSVLNVQHIDYQVPIKKWGQTVASKTILKDVSVTMRSGETLAIMGPSGAGKTTFLDLLTLGGAGGERTGHVDINGEAMTDAVFKKHCAYVPQSDSGWAFLTCRETLEYAAALHMPGSTADKAKRVDEIITTMGLEGCANTKVGNDFLKGLSGGQKRRLSLGCAFLKDPLVIFLDEVTSGLDAAAAANITSFMQQLARSHDVIIACTIHQPSAKVFRGFDRLLLLSGGCVAYSGKVSKVDAYFQSLGFTMPIQENPADFLLDSINADFTDADVVNSVLEAWATKPMRANSTGTFEIPKMHDMTSKSLCSQVVVLLRRMMLLFVRDPTVYFSRLVVCLFSCMFFALVYIKARDRTQDQVLNRLWLIMWHLGVPSQLSVAACLGQNIEFAAVRREIKAGMYDFRAYFVAQFFIQIPYMFLLSTFCIFVSGYALANWNLDAFLPSLLVHATFMFSFECFAQLSAVQFLHPLLGMFNVVQFWFASFLFGGFLVPEADTPWPLRALAYVSPIKYAAKALGNLEFTGTVWEGAVLDASPRGFRCPANAVACYGATGEQILQTMHSSAFQNMKVEDETLKDCCFMLAIALVFKIFFYIVAVMKCYDGQEVKKSAGGSSTSTSLPKLMGSKPSTPKAWPSKEFSEEEVAV